MSNIDTLVNHAKFYRNYEEIPPNNGFKNPVFDNEMSSVAGFITGSSWCGYFVMLCLYLTYTGATLRLLKKYCSPSTHQMWANFKASKEFKTSQVPKIGDLVFWQDGSGTLGHCGIVIGLAPGGFISSEGNTNSDGSRNGYEVAEHTHLLGQPHKVNGLNLLGFVEMPA